MQSLARYQFTLGGMFGCLLPKSLMETLERTFRNFGRGEMRRLHQISSGSCCLLRERKEALASNIWGSHGFLSRGCRRVKLSALIICGEVRPSCSWPWRSACKRGEAVRDLYVVGTVYLRGHTVAIEPDLAGSLNNSRERISSKL